MGNLGGSGSLGGQKGAEQALAKGWAEAATFWKGLLRGRVWEDPEMTDYRRYSRGDLTQLSFDRQPTKGCIAPVWSDARTDRISAFRAGCGKVLGPACQLRGAKTIQNCPGRTSGHFGTGF